MDYHQTLPFRGDPARAIETARITLATHSFRIESRTDTELSARGPGMYSSRQNPLVGVSRLAVSVRSGEIHLEAELGGSRFMTRFLYLFPFGIALIISTVFLIVPMPRFALAIPWLAVSPWFILSPLMAGWIRKRTLAAIDTLLHNMAS